MWHRVAVTEHTEVNRAFWDEVAPHHAASEFYAVEEFVRDPDRLGAIETAELGVPEGAIAGRSVCHLQCHIGLDSLSLARHGARVTGLDFSAESLRVARSVAERTGIPATFVRADVLEAADVLADTYDIVFTSRGVLMWIVDLDAWAANCARLLRPGGILYLLDMHPLALAVQQGESGLHLAASYFGGGEPRVTTADASYAVRDVGLQHQETREWIHPIGDVLTALINAGLIIDFLHEHPTDGPDGLPGLYSVRAHRPATPAP